RAATPGADGALLPPFPGRVAYARAVPARLRPRGRARGTHERASTGRRARGRDRARQLRDGELITARRAPNLSPPQPATSRSPPRPPARRPAPPRAPSVRRARRGGAARSTRPHARETPRPT